MNRRKWVPVVLLAGVAALVQNVIFLSRELSGPSVAPRAADDETEAASEDRDDGTPATLAALPRSELLAYLAALPESARSPFLTGDEADALGGAAPVVESAGTPRVDGVLWSSGRRVAWIDGAPRSEGESVRGYRVERIAPRGVLVSRGAERVHLPLEPRVDALPFPETQESPDAD